MSIADRRERIPGLADVPVVGILRRLPVDEVVHLVREARGAGLRVVEVTLDSGSALEQIRRLSEEVGDCTVGVGSARHGGDVGAAVKAGARFVVSPVFSESVAHACEDLQVPHLPGAATPTEIHNALAAGATAVKVFPAEQLGGPSFLRAVRAPLGEPPLLPTGGVNLDNVGEYLEAGAYAVGVGSSLFSLELAGASSELIGERIGRWIEAATR